MTVLAWTIGRYGATTTTKRSQWRCRDAKINEFRLIPTTKQHNEDAGMRNHDLYRQRRQQLTVGLALEGLDKGGLVRLDKDG